VSVGSTSLGGVVRYLTDGAHWQGPNGIPTLTAQHLGYSAETLAISAVVALPLGLLAGHTRRGGTLLSVLSDASRALPTLGLLYLLAIAVGVGFEAALVPVVVLAIPSLLINTYLGVRGVDRELVDAAVGMGLTPWQVLTRVEIPNALPLIILGLRTAALQVISTVTIAAYVGLGGLGRLISDGEGSGNFAELLAGAVVVAVFAIAVELLLLALQRVAVSPGVRVRPSGR
jgi:osmoprotectant transport system permease protein